MSGSKRFWFPTDLEVQVKIIESIPKDWGWVDGIIRFPSDQARFRQIAHGTGYAITRYNCSQPAIVGSAIKGSSTRRSPDLVAIMVENKLPSFITFDMAGYGKQSEFVSVREIIVSFVRRGYAGWLNFIKSAHDNSRDCNSARCELRIAANGEGRSEIVLKWENKFGGSPKDLVEILTTCYVANLVSAEPKIAAFT